MRSFTLVGRVLMRLDDEAIRPGGQVVDDEASRPDGQGVDDNEARLQKRYRSSTVVVECSKARFCLEELKCKIAIAKHKKSSTKGQFRNFWLISQNCDFESIKSRYFEPIKIYLDIPS